jgi:hypothetical protein
MKVCWRTFAGRRPVKWAAGEHTRFAFDAELELEAAEAGDKANTDSERWMLRLSQTTSHRASAAALRPVALARVLRRVAALKNRYIARADSQYD